MQIGVNAEAIYGERPLPAIAKGYLSDRFGSA
jgi:hypothetical protein